MKIDKENKTVYFAKKEWNSNPSGHLKKYLAQDFFIVVENEDGSTSFTTGYVSVPPSFEQEELFRFIDQGLDAMFLRPRMYGSSAMLESIFMTYMSFYDFAIHGPWSADDKRYNTGGKYRKFSEEKRSGSLGLSSLYPDVNDFVKVLQEFREEHMKT